MAEKNGRGINKEHAPHRRLGATKCPQNMEPEDFGCVRYSKRGLGFQWLVCFCFSLLFCVSVFLPPPLFRLFPKLFVSIWLDLWTLTFRKWILHWTHNKLITCLQRGRYTTKKWLRCPFGFPFRRSPPPKKKERENTKKHTNKNKQTDKTTQPHPAPPPPQKKKKKEKKEKQKKETQKRQTPHTHTHKSKEQKTQQKQVPKTGATRTGCRGYASYVRQEGVAEFAVTGVAFLWHQAGGVGDGGTGL